MVGIPAHWANGPTSPSAIGAADITPDDATDLPLAARAICIGVLGTLKVTHLDGTTVTYTAAQLTLGINPLTAVRVWATGTTATTMKALF